MICQVTVEIFFDQHRESSSSFQSSIRTETRESYEGYSRDIRDDGGWKQSSESVATAKNIPKADSESGGL